MIRKGNGFMHISKYQVKIRLYSPHDLDLLSYWGDNKQIVRAAYVSLKAFAAGEHFVFISPENATFPLGRLKGYSLCLDHEFDRDVIRMLEAVSPGARNNFIRCIMREYILTPTGDISINPGEIPWFHERFRMLRGDTQAVSLEEKWDSLQDEYRAFKKEKRKKEKGKKKQVKVTVLKDTVPKEPEEKVAAEPFIPAPMEDPPVPNEEITPTLPALSIPDDKEIKANVPEAPAMTISPKSTPVDEAEGEDTEPLFDEDALTAAFDLLF